MSNVELSKQFIVCRREELVPATWETSELLGRIIGRSPQVGLTRLTDRDGEVHSVAIGWPIYEGRLLITADGPKEAHLAVSADDFAWKAAGRYLLLTLDAGDGALNAIPDAGGFLGSVYAPSLDIVASTTSLVPKEAGTGELSVLADVLNIGIRNGYYPFGFTNRAGIYRLTPNTRLNLEDYTVARQDYMSPERYASGDPADLIPEISEGVRSNITAVTEHGRTALHLTAGWDSRMMLAAGRDVLDRIELQTIEFEYYTARLDAHVARKISRRFNLDHRVYPFVPTPKEEADAWLYRTGYCVRDQVTDLAMTAKSMDLGNFSIMGTTGEVGRGRAHYWREEELDAPAPDAETVLGRLGFPMHPTLLGAAEKWLGQIPATTATMVWDNAYIQQRVGCWTGATVYGHPIHYPSLSPFNSRILYDMMLRLPVVYRFENEFPADLVRYFWPELLEFEVNRPAGIDKLKFWRSEISQAMPPGLKARLKAVRSRLS